MSKRIGDTSRRRRTATQARQVWYALQRNRRFARRMFGGDSACQHKTEQQTQS
jgi:hypothetical protein